MRQRFVTLAAGVLLLLGGAMVACAPQGGGGAASSVPAASPATARVPTAEQVGETLASVNGMPIGTKEFDQMAMRQVGRDGSLSEEARNEVIARLVDEKLLYQEALRQGIDKDPKLQKMMVNTLLKEAVYNSARAPAVSDEELRSYFESHKQDFVVPEKVQVKHILIKADAGESADAAKARAESVRAEVLSHREDFKNIAQRYSSGPFARRGGEMGFVSSAGKPGVPTVVVEQAFMLQKGEVSEVFSSDDGWNIVYVPNRRERVERTFEQMRGSVQRKVKSNRYRQLFDDYVGALKNGADISIDESKVSAHEVVPPAPPAAAAARRAAPPPPAAKPAAAGLKGPGPGDGHGH